MNLKKNIALSESGFLFDSNTGDSYTLNDTGKLIVQMIKENKTEGEIIAHFKEFYDVEEGIFENNFHDFISMIKHLNIIEV
jgi:hypothetical protein